MRFLRSRFESIALAAVALSLLPLRGEVSLAAPGVASRPVDGKSDEAERSEFQKIYSLKSGEDLKLVPPPRPKSANAWMMKESPHLAGRLDEVTAMTFRWRDPDHLKQWSAQFGSGKGWALRSIPRYLEMNLHEFEIEGDRKLLNTEIPGDWVYREGVPDERKARALETILKKTLDPKLVIEFRLVERNVVVVRGKYRYTPIGNRTKNQIEIYGKQIVKGGGGHGGGSGTFPEFLKWVGDWIETPVVSEVTTPPRDTLSWSYNGRSPSTAKERQEDHDETLVLKHLEEQTGLTYTVEPRDIRVLFVEKAK
jgi:hypothetical protein